MRVAWNKGKKRPPFSAEWIRNMSLSRIGRKSPMLGKKHKPETIEKLKKWRPSKEQILKSTRKGEDHGKWTPHHQRLCASCKKEMFVRISSTTKYCSYACMGFSKRKIFPTCMFCNKTLSKMSYKTCKTCCRKWFRGPRNANWRGGITEKNTRIRKSEKYSLWRTSVFKRDKYRCRYCSCVGGRLQAHHIKKFSTHPRLRFSINNGITLCEPCHDKEHCKGWTQIEFIHAYYADTSNNMIYRSRVYKNKARKEYEGLSK